MWNPFRKRSVVIVAHYASFAGAGEILTELRRREEWEARLIVDRRDEHQGFWREYAPVYWPELGEPERRAVSRELRGATLGIVAGACSLDLWTRILAGAPDRRTSFRREELERVLPEFYDHARRHRTVLLVSDSPYLVDTARWNEHFARLAGLQVLMMPDLLPFADPARAIPFWPVVDCRALPRPDGNGAITVGHSPSKAGRRAQKGTDLIQDVCERNAIPLEIVTELPYKEALARKARFAVFVDQVADRIFASRGWHGGLGKSGLEALALGCSVITSGSVASTEPWFPDPPVVWTDRESFERDLVGLVRDPERVRELGARGRRWAGTVAAPRAMVDHILACAERT
jgi:hypothetical protein